MQNDNKEKRPEENLIVLQEKSNANNKNRHSIDSNNSSTFYSPRNRAKTFHKMNRNIAALYKLTFVDFGSIDLERTSEKKKTRIDNFGREIKKGGKQKIVFADELHLVKTNKKRRNSYPKIKNKKAKDETYKAIKRSNSSGMTINFNDLDPFEFFTYDLITAVIKQVDNRWV